jgi:prophage regulatory protein
MQDQIYRLPAVEARTGLSRTGVYEAMARNEFPQSIKLGPRAVGWAESEITAWIESRKAMRDTAGC